MLFWTSVLRCSLHADAQRCSTAESPLIMVSALWSSSPSTDVQRRRYLEVLHAPRSQVAILAERGRPALHRQGRG